jgi:hypoxanthine phosphoribosyltransferase
MKESLWVRKHLLNIDWETMGLLLQKLVDEIRASDFRPDSVVGISRGGLPPAIALSNLLEVPDFRILGIPRNQSNSRYSERQAPRFEYLVPDKPLTGRRLLLVDDIMGDGGTMDLAASLMRERGAAEIRTVVVVWNVNGQGNVDHHAVAVDDWTVFPWEAPPTATEKTVELRYRA